MIRTKYWKTFTSSVDKQAKKKNEKIKTGLKKSCLKIIKG
jgi:hypothetical protein